MGYTVWPIANGNWSNAANWSSGAVPTLDDDVYLNGKTITADQHMECYTIRNDAVRCFLPNMVIPTMINNNSGAEYSTTLAVGIADASSNSSSAWNAFRFAGPTTPWASGTSNTGWVSYKFPTGKIIKRYRIGASSTAASRPKDWTFEGSNDGSSWVVLDTVTGASSNVYISTSLSNTTPYTYYRINITAVQTAGSAPHLIAFEMTESTSSDISSGAAGGTLTITTAYNLTLAESFRIFRASNTLITISATSGTVNIGSNSGHLTRSGYTLEQNAIGIVISGSGVTVNTSGVISTNTVTGNSGAFIFSISGAANVNHTGVVNSTTVTIAGSNNGSFSISNANAILTINGNLIGATTSNVNLSNSVYSTVAATVIINGNIFGGVSVPITLTSSTSNLTINGNCIAYDSTNGNAISSVGNVLLNGTSTNINGVNAIYSRGLKLKSTAQIVWTFQDDIGNDKTLYTAGIPTGHPAEEDVREGTIYGPADELEGTLIVADPGNVRKGVPTDDTVGTADLTAEDLLNTINSSSLDVAVRMRNCATPDIVAAIVTASS